MQIIIISSNSTFQKQWNLTRKRVVLLTMLSIILLIASTLSVMYVLKQSGPPILLKYVTIDAPDAASKKAEINEFYAKRLGTLQAEAIRLKALATKFATMIGLETSEYLLSEPLGQGGIEELGQHLSQDEFNHDIEQLTTDFSEREEQLAALEHYLIINSNIQAAIPAGRPVVEGWVSSYYGRRIDPFNGRKTFHHGLDFAGRLGSDVVAVADGMVTWTGKNGGYGRLVEVDHGNGYVTRYAHNKAITVQSGDRVEKGQVLALMGSTGRSTGPHVHFEVLLDGKHINPYSFVKRQ